MRRGSWVVFLTLALASCSAESRLWRITPLTSSGAPDPERVNGWPLVYSDRGATSVLWPLMDFDQRGFAVRPLVSKDDGELDVLWPLSHVDMDDGEGWVLNGYRFGGGAGGDNTGLFPLCNFGPVYNWFLPACWRMEEGKVASFTLFPVAHVDNATHDGWILNAYSFGANRGLFPFFNFSPEFNFVGPAWWRPARSQGEQSEESAFGLFPLFTWSPFRQFGPVWWTKPGDEGGTHFGAFPLVWGENGGSRLLVLPFYYQDVGQDPERGHQQRALLLPPTWWETNGDEQRHVVFPFYAHIASSERELTAWMPFFARSTRAGGTQWFSLVANGWNAGEASGLNVYPLYWSGSAPGRSHQMLAPLWLYRERDDERLLLTPLGGWGWDASGSTRFVNFLGPLYHHSIGPQTETTSVIWPLFEREKTADSASTRALPLFGTTATPAGRDTWAVAGLARHVTDHESSSFRFWPLYGHSDAEETPDLLYDLSLFSSHSHGDEWSQHLFPLYAASGEGTQRSFSALFGLAHVGSTGAGSSWRLWPLASSSTDPDADGFVDRATLFRHERRGDVSRDWLFPLYTGYRDPGLTSHTALFGLGRAASTPTGSSWRLLPLASGSTDPGADTWVDRATLFRHEQRGDLSRTWLFPLWSSVRGPELVDDDLLLLLARHKRTAAGSAWRLWPLFSTTDADGLDDVIDPFTLIGWHPHAGKTHLHVGTSLLFAYDRYGPGKRSWDTRVATFFDVGHQEFAPSDALPSETTDPAQPPRSITLERSYAGFLFDWFLVQNRVVQPPEGGRREESHYRLPLLHEYESEGDRKEWDLLCYAVHSKKDPQEERFSVLRYAYRSVKTGDETTRDIFPFITLDTAPDKKRFSFLWRLFRYERDGAKSGGHIFFIPWGDASL